MEAVIVVIILTKTLPTASSLPDINSSNIVEFANAYKSKAIIPAPRIIAVITTGEYLSLSACDTGYKLVVNSKHKNNFLNIFNSNIY
ncbi:hypothetical protein C0J27_05550 [Candidatus Chromulinivorax destructor]|uniref:Uncharacterized protein n=1 Tax=Candidatus Chromulinivorax destructor TaxID=2066483 RepID=A0A345ZCZ9_9BACT|nr:hypothetical protein C0J27_05550 [Candidatus Chromulinivorax destructor]